MYPRIAQPNISKFIKTIQGYKTIDNAEDENASRYKT
jgi:hypothetical protein